MTAAAPHDAAELRADPLALAQWLAVAASGISAEDPTDAALLADVTFALARLEGRPARPRATR